MNPHGEVLVQGGRGRWQPNRERNELRRPQSDGNVLGEGPSKVTTIQKCDNSDVAAQSKLSVEAKEFIPKSFNSANFNRAEQPEFVSEDEHFNESDESLIFHLSDVMEAVTCSPGQFDQLVLPLVSELAPVLGDKSIVRKLVSLIVEQALVEHNFRYSGARLCCALSSAPQPGQSSVFREVLLNRISDIHQIVKNGTESDESRIYGFVHFLGELYIQMGNQNESVLSTAILETFSLLLKMPNTASIKAVCEILKLTAGMLAAEKPKEIDACISNLKTLCESTIWDSRTKAIVKNVVDLYENNWGKTSVSDTQPTPVLPCQQSDTSSSADGIVMYGPDGLELTVEEREFLDESTEAPRSDTLSDDWDLGDEATDEVMAEFEKFVSLLPPRR